VRTGLKVGAGRRAGGELPALAWQEEHPVRVGEPWERLPRAPPEVGQGTREGAASQERRLPWVPEVAGGRKAAEPERWPCVEQEA